MDDREVTEKACDSGFTAQAIEDAENLWSELPVFPRKWHEMQTYEKAAICRAVQRFRAEVEADQIAALEASGRVIVPVEDLNEAVCTLAAIRADRSTCGHYQELAGVGIQRLNKWITAAKGQTDGR